VTTVSSQVADSTPEPGPRVLFLDDDPKRAGEFVAKHPQAVWVRTAAECIARLSEEWGEVHLDHDLGGEIFVDSSREDCGMEVVRWLCAADRPSLRHDALFVIHTHNMNAAGAMVHKLQEAGYLAVYRPFGIDLERWISELDRNEQLEPSEPGPPRHSRGLHWPRWLSRLSRKLGPRTQTGPPSACSPPEKSPESGPAVGRDEETDSVHENRAKR
jgi:hypothetical protein